MNHQPAEQPLGDEDWAFDWYQPAVWMPGIRIGIGLVCLLLATHLSLALAQRSRSLGGPLAAIPTDREVTWLVALWGTALVLPTLARPRNRRWRTIRCCVVLAVVGASVWGLFSLLS